ncbi:MAG: GNAT family N-acetyltransferase [Actinomycetota bacterium]
MTAKKRIQLISHEGDITLRTIEKDDIESIRKWRNENREYFFYKKIIKAPQQLDWFQTYINSSEYIFIVEHEGLKVGCIGYRFLNDDIDVYNVILGNKKFRGKGIMSKALKLICSYIMDNYNKEITLMVVPKNNARIFYLKNNFEEVRREEKFILMKLNINKFEYLKYNLEVN